MSPQDRQRATFPTSHRRRGDLWGWQLVVEPHALWRLLRTLGRAIYMYTASLRKKARTGEKGPSASAKLSRPGSELQRCIAPLGERGGGQSACLSRSTRIGNQAGYRWLDTTHKEGSSRDVRGVAASEQKCLAGLSLGPLLEATRGGGGRCTHFCRTTMS